MFAALEWKRTWLVLALMVLAFLALWAVSRPESERPQAKPLFEHPGQRQNTTLPEGETDWKNPLPDSVPQGSASDAASLVPFNVLTPNNVGTPTQILVSNPQHALPADRGIAFVYDHPTYGRFVVFEDVVPSLTQSDLEARLQYNNPSPAPGATVTSDAVFSLVTIRNDVTAVLEVGKTVSADGQAPNSIEWLDHGVNITIMGPDSTFTAEVAKAVANAV